MAYFDAVKVGKLVELGLLKQFLCDCAGNNNSFSAKSKKNGGVQFSRDPLNLTNISSRKV